MLTIKANHYSAHNMVGPTLDAKDNLDDLALICQALSKLWT